VKILLRYLQPPPDGLLIVWIFCSKLSTKARLFKENNEDQEGNKDMGDGETGEVKFHPWATNLSCRQSLLTMI